MYSCIAWLMAYKIKPYTNSFKLTKIMMRTNKDVDQEIYYKVQCKNLSKKQNKQKRKNPAEIVL